MNLRSMTIAVLAIMMMALVAIAIGAQEKPTPSSGTGDPEWGNEYSTQEDMANLKAALSAMAENPEGAREYCFPLLVVGPALWSRLKMADKNLVNYGTDQVARYHGHRGMFIERWFMKEERVPLWKSPAMRLLGKTFEHGNIRAASSKEREIWFNWAPTAAKTRALSVVQVGESVLMISFNEGKVAWLEMVSDWKNGKAP